MNTAQNATSGCPMCGAKKAAGRMCCSLLCEKRLMKETGEGDYLARVPMRMPPKNQRAAEHDMGGSGNGSFDNAIRRYEGE